MMHLTVCAMSKLGVNSRMAAGLNPAVSSSELEVVGAKRQYVSKIKHNTFVCLLETLTTNASWCK